MNKIEIMDKISEIAEDVADKATDIFDNLKDKVSSGSTKEKPLPKTQDVDNFDDEEENKVLEVFKDAMFNFGEGVENIGEKIKDKFSK